MFTDAYIHVRHSAAMNKWTRANARVLANPRAANEIYVLCIENILSQLGERSLDLTAVLFAL